MTLRPGKLLGASALALAAFAGAAHAQQPAEGDIIVTAQKRAENLQSVPLAVSVVTAAQLERSATFGTEALAARVPTLTFQKGTTNVNSSFNIRGIGTISFASAVEPSVSTVVDGVVYARAGQAFFDFMDLERIEVLRGPQSTLFGRNASAGVVSLTTKAPSREFGVSAEASWFEGNEMRARATVTGPLGDKAAGSVTVMGSKYDGNAKNVFTGSDVNGFKRFGVRGRLDTELDSTLKFSFIGDYVNGDDNCCADAIGLAPTADPVTGSTTGNNAIYNAQILGPSLAPAKPGLKNKDIDNNFGPLTKDKSWGLSGQADWDITAGTLKGHTLTAIVAYRGWQNTENRDGDFRSDSPLYVRNASGPTANDRDYRDQGTIDFSQTSQEIRLASPTGQFLEYVIGAFNYQTDQTNWFNRTITACTSSTATANAQGFIPCASPATFTIAQISNGTANWNTKFANQAVFGQATLNFTEDFRGIVGGRIVHDEVRYDFNRVAAVAGPAVTASFAGQGKTTNNGSAGKVGLQYDLSDRTMVYGTLSRGYKGPAFNVFFNMAAANQVPISEETSDARELGLKTQSADRKFTFNLAVFDATYNDFQANSFILVSGSPVSSLVNAGEVRSKGFDADFRWAPVEGLRLDGGVAYADAKIINFPCSSSLPTAQFNSCTFASGFGLPANANRLNNSPLPFAPKWKFNVGGEYTLPLGLPFDVRVNSAYVWQDDTQYDIQQSPFAMQKAYGLLDAGVTFAAKNDAWRLSVIGKNLTDEFYAVTKVIENGAVRQRIPRDAERYFGVSFRVATN
ncbi:MAG: TonB-dependent receptor [Alphaproteobacteria bacterium]|nr:TonB-dependent receptor [Alphaproteobacteria bacterium]